MNRTINVGLIGYGLSGQVFHAPIINSVPGFNLLKVVERHGEKSKERYPWVEVVKDADSVFNDKNIELVVIALPTTLHFEMAKAALLSGKHVIVEKPFTVTSDEAGELISLAKKQGRILSAYQNRRFDGDFQTVKKIIESGILGNLVEYESHFDRYKNFIKIGSWKEKDEQGMGLQYNLGSHVIDQALVLFGLPKTVTADMRIQRDGGKNIDSFEILLGYDNLKVTLKSGMIVREPGPRFAVHGMLGSFIKYGEDIQEAELKNGQYPLNNSSWGMEPKEIWGTLNTQINGLHFQGKIETLPGNYRTYYQNIFGAVVNGEELMVKPEEAGNTIRIIELAVKSSREGRTIEFSL